MATTEIVIKWMPLNTYLPKMVNAKIEGAELVQEDSGTVLLASDQGNWVYEGCVVIAPGQPSWVELTNGANPRESVTHWAYLPNAPQKAADIIE
jgi:hypothetical protein